MSSDISASMATVEKVMRHSRRRLRPNAKITLHDNSSPGYGWLILGWLCEERMMESRRVYRYYYDPDGTLYRTTRQEVLSTWEKCGLILMDK